MWTQTTKAFASLLTPLPADTKYGQQCSRAPVQVSICATVTARNTLIIVSRDRADIILRHM